MEPPAKKTLLSTSHAFWRAMSPCVLGCLISFLTWKTPLNPIASFDIAPEFKWILFWLVLSVVFESAALVFAKLHSGTFSRVARALFAGWAAYVAACGMTLASLVLMPEAWGTLTSAVIASICCATLLWIDLKTRYGESQSSE